MANGYRSLEGMYPMVGGAGELGQLSDADMGMVTPEMIRAQLAGATGNASDLERQILERRIADQGVTGVGPVPEMPAGYFQDPKNIVQLSTIPIGGLAAGMGAGAKGIAHYTARRAAVEGLKPLGESIFAEGTMPSVSARLAAAALGIGGATTALAGGNPLLGEDPAVLAKMGTPEAQVEIQRQYDERSARFAEAQEAKKLAQKTLPAGWTFRDLTSDPDFGNAGAFRAKYGMDPVEAMNLLEKRGQKNPVGGFRRTM